MHIERTSHCKVNLLLNLLGKRSDGFHELETVLLPIPLTDRLTFEPGTAGIELTCNHPGLPVDQGNLVHRAATRFLAATGTDPNRGVRIHLEKRLPLAAGLGAGSANAAITLLALDEMFGHPLDRDRLHAIAAELGSDVPFFLQNQAALAIGRGECITPLGHFPALEGCGMILVHPGFGVPTAWAYQAMKEFPEAIEGRRGRAQELIASLQAPGRGAWRGQLYNALEAPVLRKYPLLRVLQDHLLAEGSLAALMSGSGSTTFAITDSLSTAQRIAAGLPQHFGKLGWVETCALPSSAAEFAPAGS